MPAGFETPELGEEMPAGAEARGLRGEMPTGAKAHQILTGEDAQGLSGEMSPGAEAQRSKEEVLNRDEFRAGKEEPSDRTEALGQEAAEQEKTAVGNVSRDQRVTFVKGEAHGPAPRFPLPEEGTGAAGSMLDTRSDSSGDRGWPKRGKKQPPNRKGQKPKVRNLMVQFLVMELLMYS